jgi:hypothetical protein
MLERNLSKKRWSGVCSNFYEKFLSFYIEPLLGDFRPI